MYVDKFDLYCGQVFVCQIEKWHFLLNCSFVDCVDLWNSSYLCVSNCIRLVSILRDFSVHNIDCHFGISFVLLVHFFWHFRLILQCNKYYFSSLCIFVVCVCVLVFVLVHNCIRSGIRQFRRIHHWESLSELLLISSQYPLWYPKTKSILSFIF